MLATYVLVLCCVSSGWTQRVVDTEYGQVRGHIVNVNNGVEQTTVEVFYGIPYAADTSQSNRFRSPVPPAPWIDILEADIIPEACPQSNISGFNVGEDCLKMNVYTPSDTSQTYAVMVYIYGGAYQAGANFWHPGHFLASRGVIVACLNYRLGKFGFQYTANDAAPGNAGMWDQHMGLQWVVDNIANFGGDPTRITLFGQSAGASSTALHMLSPHSNTLFQQAITESGSDTVLWAINPPESDPQNYTYSLAEKLNCSDPDDYAMMDCMRALPWQQIMDYSMGRCAPGFICLGMSPVVDGPGGFMPQKPALQRMAGDVMQGSIISGIAKEDGSTFTPIIAPRVIFEGCCNRSYFEHCLENNLVGRFLPRMSAQSGEDLYQAINWKYSPWPHVYDTDDNRDKLVEIVTDVAFGLPWDRQLKDHESVAPSWGYLFDYMSNYSTSEDWIGTPHSAEIDYVWGFPLMSFNPEVEEDSNLNGGLYSQLDIEFSIFVQELWTNFAKTGNPTPTPVYNPVSGEPYTWPQFTDGEMNFLNMERFGIRNEVGYRQQEYAFWGNYIMSIAGEEVGIADEWVDYNDDMLESDDILNLWLAHVAHLYGGEETEGFFDEY